ncbi:MAG: hypothetical protein WCC89_11845, partial [Candidatus Sulfotelmatobacter sp.]
FCAAKDLGEPREVSRSLRHNNRAFGSLPYHAALHHYPHPGRLTQPPFFHPPPFHITKDYVLTVPTLRPSAL